MRFAGFFSRPARDRNLATASFAVARFVSVSDLTYKIESLPGELVIALLKTILYSSEFLLYEKRDIRETA